MKASNQILLCALLLFSVQNRLAAESSLPEMKETGLLETSDQTASLLPATGVQKVKFDEGEAWTQFCLAKNSSAADVQSEAYAKAIQYISAATTAPSAPPEAFLLASRIYRHKGGASYAKNYFTRAAAVYLDEAMQQPESIEMNLKAAIVLYAGDVRYWDSYEQCKKNAWSYADTVLVLCKKAKVEKNLTTEKEVFLEEAAALACIVKENMVESNAHFAKASKLWNKEAAKTESNLINIIGLDNYGLSTTGSLYLPYELFKEYAQQGEWYWSIASKTDVGKEFLLNCLTGFYLAK